MGLDQLAETSSFVLGEREPLWVLEAERNDRQTWADGAASVCVKQKRDWKDGHGGVCGAALQS